MSEKLACDGRILKWESRWIYPEPDPLTPEDILEPYDENEPGHHEPWSSKFYGLDALTDIMIHGHTCGWCNVYQPAPVEAIVDNIFKPSPLLEALKRK